MTDETLAEHERRDAAWMARVEHELSTLKGSKMEGVNSDKVNIHLGDGGRGGDSGATAAIIAALGNRNQGGDNAALIAALGDGGRGDDSNGINALLPILLLAMLGRRGLGGDDTPADAGCARTALTQTIVEAVGDIRAQVPQVALETQNQICQSMASLALGTQQGFANVKDSVQTLGALNLTATQGVSKDVATGTLSNQIAITADGEKTRALLIAFNNDNLQRQLTVAQSALSEERVHRHSDGVEVRVNQTVQQAQAQNQQQAQLQGLVGLVANLANDIQAVRQGQVIFNSGTMAASGTQAAANTRL